MNKKISIRVDLFLSRALLFNCIPRRKTTTLPDERIELQESA
jgi:hypothetical protein